MSATPPTPGVVVPPALVAGLLGLGPWGGIAAVAVLFGLPFAEHLVANIANNTPVTPEEWGKLKAKNAIPYDDLPGGATP